MATSSKAKDHPPINIQHTTWMILRDGDRVLLGHKKTGFGAGNINGIGGKVEPGETIEQAAIRETKEEIGVTATKYEEVAVITFDDLYYRGVKQQHIMHCFIAAAWQGNPIETREILPEWFNIPDLDYSKMWADDEFWLPQVLSGKKVEARFKFNKDDKIVSQTVSIVQDFHL